MFVLMYSIVDYSNLRYRFSFAIPHNILLAIFFLPIFLPLFYNQIAQIFSISIAILAVLVNANVLHLLHYKGFSKLFSSRISTAVASIVEIILFSAILHLGLKGAILMTILRPIYISFVPKFIFKTPILKLK